jgi:hypothetical protein
MPRGREPMHHHRGCIGDGTSIVSAMRIGIFRQKVR